MQRQRPGHRIWSFHHRGLLLLVYSCSPGVVYSPRGRLVFIPLAQVSGSSTTSLFSAFIWKNRSCPPHGTMCGPI